MIYINRVQKQEKKERKIYIGVFLMPVNTFSYLLH